MLGDIVGPMEGEALGDHVGPMEGEALGDHVGLMEGEMLGNIVGGMVGPSLILHTTRYPPPVPVDSKFVLNSQLPRVGP